jgi:methenyltetrahydrofolate cyclohydrolase
VTPPEADAAAGEAGRAGYLGMPLGDFLDILAAPRPDPGGGSAAALTAAVAAALCAMTAGLSARHLPEAPELAADARRLLRRAAPLAQADADAYGEVLTALRAPEQAAPAFAEGGDPRRDRIATALTRASEVPMEVAEIAAAAAAIAAAVAHAGNPSLRGDAETAARLAAAAAHAAAALVAINLAGSPDDDRPAKAASLAAEAARLADSM